MRNGMIIIDEPLEFPSKASHTPALVETSSTGLA
jgi:hypothetical protein